MTGRSNAATGRQARGIPRQKRSRARHEHILSVAGKMLLESGAEAFRMSELVDRSGVPFGSLYQYFPDRSAVIEALAHRYQEMGRECVKDLLKDVSNRDDFLRGLDGIVDGFHRMFADHPVMKPLWAATQAAPRLKEIDDQDAAAHATLLLDAYRRACPDVDAGRAAVVARLAAELISCAVRHAVGLEDRAARETLAVFKQGLKGFFDAAPRDGLLRSSLGTSRAASPGGMHRNRKTQQ